MSEGRRVNEIGKKASAGENEMGLREKCTGCWCDPFFDTR